MKLALLLTPMSAYHLTLAAQVGATDIVGMFPSTDVEALRWQCGLAEEHGLKISVIERHLPHDLLVHGRPGKEVQLEAFKALILNMSACGIRTLCYNWMPDNDWQRTSFAATERGGALVTEFVLSQVNQTLSGETTTALQSTPTVPCTLRVAWTSRVHRKIMFSKPLKYQWASLLFVH